MGHRADFCQSERVHHADLGLLVLRLGIGLTICLHGLNKVFGGGKLAGTGAWFASMGMKPGWLHARMAAATEIGAGLLLAVGLVTPAAAAGIIALMLVAGVTAHRKNGFFVFRPGQGWEYVMVLAVAAFAVGAIGAGAWSIDAALGWDVDGWWGAIVAAAGGLGGGALFLAACYRPAPAKLGA
jgi:putative oxidoreductase